MGLDVVRSEISTNLSVFELCCGSHKKAYDKFLISLYSEISLRVLAAFRSGENESIDLGPEKSHVSE